MLRTFHAPPPPSPPLFCPVPQCGVISNKGSFLCSLRTFESRTLLACFVGRFLARLVQVAQPKQKTLTQTDVSLFRPCGVGAALGRGRGGGERRLSWYTYVHADV